LSINRYKVMDYEEVAYEDPEVILKKIEIIEKEIISGLGELKKL